MDGSLHELIAVNYTAPTTSKPHMLSSWPHVNFTGLTYTQSHVPYQDEWKKAAFVRPMVE